jgi:hypothetical protein
MVGFRPCIKFHVDPIDMFHTLFIPPLVISITVRLIDEIHLLDMNVLDSILSFSICH